MHSYIIDVPSVKYVLIYNITNINVRMHYQCMTLYLTISLDGKKKYVVIIINNSTCLFIEKYNISYYCNK